MGTVAITETKTMLTLPGDAVRQILWRFAGRFDLQMLVQSARGVARGTVARLVAAGERNTHEWTPAKGEMLEAFDRAGITAAFMEPEEGGFIVGPKNLALALAAFELAWVDGGAATASLAGFLALSPIHERGTPEQVTTLQDAGSAPAAGRRAQALARRVRADRADSIRGRGYRHVERQGARGRVERRRGAMLQVDKRGRFITNIAFANFVTAAVNSDDERIKGSCVVILEETDEGTFDRGTATKKLVHQLSSTGDPIFNLKVPASRIVGGYTVKDGVIVPNFNHSEMIEAVFRRTRVPVGLMTAAKLLSAVEPVIRYQRARFRGAERREARLGSLRAGHPAARRCAAPAGGHVGNGRSCRVAGLCRGAAVRRAGSAGKAEDGDPERARRSGRARGDEGAEGERTAGDRIAEAQGGRSATRGAGSRSAGAVCTEGCRGQCAVPGDQAVEHRPRRQHDARGGEPDGRLRHHGGLPGVPGQQMDGRATGGDLRRPRSRAAPAVDGDHDERSFPGPVPRVDARRCARIASTRPGTGACTLASAMKLWLWTLNYLQKATDPAGGKLYHGQRQGVTFALADALCWLLASRCQILDVLELEARGSGGRGGCRRSGGDRAVLQRPVPHAGGAGGRRGFAHLRRAGVWLQPASGVG